jgi:hypothetical protein
MPWNLFPDYYHDFASQFLTFHSMMAPNVCITIIATIDCAKMHKKLAPNICLQVELMYDGTTSFFL